MHQTISDGLVLTNFQNVLGHVDRRNLECKSVTLWRFCRRMHLVVPFILTVFTLLSCVRSSGRRPRPPKEKFQRSVVRPPPPYNGLITIFRAPGSPKRLLRHPVLERGQPWASSSPWRWYHALNVCPRRAADFSHCAYSASLSLVPSDQPHTRFGEPLFHGRVSAHHFLRVPLQGEAGQLLPADTLPASLKNRLLSSPRARLLSCYCGFENRAKVPPQPYVLMLTARGGKKQGMDA